MFRVCKSLACGMVSKVSSVLLSHRHFMNFGQFAQTIPEKETDYFTQPALLLARHDISRSVTALRFAFIEPNRRLIFVLG